MRKSNIVCALRPRRRKSLPAAQIVIEPPTRIRTPRKPNSKNRQITGHNGGPGTVVGRRPRILCEELVRQPGSLSGEEATGAPGTTRPVQQRPAGR